MRTPWKAFSDWRNARKVVKNTYSEVLDKWDSEAGMFENDKSRLPIPTEGPGNATTSSTDSSGNAVPMKNNGAQERDQELLRQIKEAKKEYLPPYINEATIALKRSAKDNGRGLDSYHANEANNITSRMVNAFPDAIPAKKREELANYLVRHYPLCYMGDEARKATVALFEGKEIDATTDVSTLLQEHEMQLKLSGVHAGYVVQYRNYLRDNSQHGIKQEVVGYFDEVAKRGGQSIAGLGEVIQDFQEEVNSLESSAEEISAPQDDQTIQLPEDTGEELEDGTTITAEQAIKEANALEPLRIVREALSRQRKANRDGKNFALTAEEQEAVKYVSEHKLAINSWAAKAKPSEPSQDQGPAHRR